jgi:hypothetical protein
MKKIHYLAAVAALCFSACSADEPALSSITIKADDSPIEDYATITFNCRGDFSLSTESFTRALTADGKAMTDLWVLDYPSGATVPTIQLHQVSTDDDFGSPTLNLTVGSHHIYFIASRGSGATLSTADHTITFSKVLDTFYYDLSLNVTASSNGSRTVTLDRCVTKLTTTITDAIPAGAATFNITPATWYYSFDYVNGTPGTATASQTITIDIPSSEIGVTNEKLNIFGFSGSDEWTTDIALDCRKSDNTILGTATIASAPFKQNRITLFSGPLFSAEGLTTVSLSTDWQTDYTGTW